MLLSPIRCCYVTKPPLLAQRRTMYFTLHSNRLFVYTVCCRRRGQCFSVFRTRHTDAVGDSSGRSYATEQGRNVTLLRTRGLNQSTDLVQNGYLGSPRKYLETFFFFSFLPTPKIKVNSHMKKISIFSKMSSTILIKFCRKNP